MAQLELLLHGFLRASHVITRQQLRNQVYMQFASDIISLVTRYHRKTKQGGSAVTIDEITAKARDAAYVVIDEYERTGDFGVELFEKRLMSAVEHALVELTQIRLVKKPPSFQPPACVPRANRWVIPDSFVPPSTYTRDTELPPAAPVLLPELETLANPYHRKQLPMLITLRRVLGLVPGPRFHHRAATDRLLECRIFMTSAEFDTFLRHCIADSICIDDFGGGERMWNYARVRDRMLNVVDSEFPSEPDVYPSWEHVMHGYVCLRERHLI